MSFTPEKIQYYEEHKNDTLQPEMIASTVCGLVLAYIAVVARIIARQRSAAHLGADDWLCMIALLPLTGYGICAFYGVHVGEGLHIIFVKSPRGFIEEYVAAITSYALTTIFTKCSILLFYYRIFKSQSLLHFGIVIGVVVILYNIALVLVTALECIPLSTLWTMKPGGKCINTLPPFTVLAVINVVTDIAILTLPVKYVWKLQMRTPRKLQVLSIFLLGAVVCVFGIVRTVEIAQAKSYDQSYTSVYSGIWSFEEIAIGIVAACLPTLGIFFTKTKTKMSWSNSARDLFGGTWSRLSSKFSRSGNNSTADPEITLGNFDHKNQVWSSVEHNSESEFANSGSFTRVSTEEADLEGNRVPAQQIYVRRDVDQSYQDV